MEWVIGLGLVLIVPFVIILWWIPRCDVIGIEVARTRFGRSASHVA
jgi:hypothetical protein